MRGDERRHARLAEELARAACLDEAVGAREEQRVRSERQLAQPVGDIVFDAERQAGGGQLLHGAAAGRALRVLRPAR